MPKNLFNTLTIISLAINLILIGALAFSNIKNEKMEIDHKKHDMSMMKPTSNSSTFSSMAMTHMHEDFDIPEDSKTVPTVVLKTYPDSKSGYNIEIVTTNFTFAPEKANIETGSYNEGHVHLSINGQMISRIYGAWTHIPSTLLTKDSNVIEVSLNSNTHKSLHFKTLPIDAKATVAKK
jgi:hypothetical protein